MPTQQTSSSEDKQIHWQEYNYPPLLNLMHFRLNEIPSDRKFIILSLFIIHIIILCNTFVNFVLDCFIGGLGILYSILFIFIFNPIVLFMFYRGYVGLCKDKGKLSLYTYIQPIVIILEIVLSIIYFLGFNGFVAVSHYFKYDQTGLGLCSLVISLIYLLVALFSGFIYYKIFREKSILTRILLN